MSECSGSGAELPFAINDRGAFWVVERGTADIYALPIQPGRADGPLRFLMSVPEGQAIFGTGAADEFEFRLVARGREGTRIARHDTEDLLAEAARTGNRLVLLEGWIIEISKAVAGSLAGRYSLIPPSGTLDLTLEDEPRMIVPESGVAWIRPERGPCYKLPGLRSAIGAEGHSAWFPLTRHSPVQAQPGSVTVAESTEEILALGAENVLGGLSVFNQQILYQIRARLDAVHADEEQTLERRVRLDKRSLDEAVSVLSSPLRNDPAPVQYDRARPLLRACELVARAGGIEIQPPASIRFRGGVRDPVSRIAKASGARVRRVTLAGEWWRRCHTALIGFRESDNSPVALLPRKRGGYICIDTRHGTSASVNPLLASSLRPFAYMLYRPFPSVSLGVGAVVRAGLRGCRNEAFVIIAVSLALGSISAIVPLATVVVFDRLIPGAYRNEMAAFGTFLLVAAVCSGLFGLVRSLAILRLQGKLDLALQAALWDRLLDLPVSFFSRFSAGDLAMRSLGFSDMRRILSGHVVSVLITLVTSTFSLGVIFLLSLKLGIVEVCLILAGLLVVVLEGLLQVRHQRELQDIAGKISGKMLEILNGIAKIRVANAEMRLFRSWTDKFIRQVRRSVKIRRSQNRLAIFSTVYPVVSLAAIFLANSVLFSSGSESLTTGEFLGIVAAHTQVASAMVSVAAVLGALSGVVPQFDRVSPILREFPETQAAKSDPGELDGLVEFDRVTFHYEASGAPVLHEVSIRIMPGEFVAIVGPSGSGKSTLLRLLLGFEAPDSGGIYFDGRDLAGLDARECRKQIGVVLQDGMLTSGSILSNIVGASGEFSIEDAWQAARLSGLHQDIEEMPMGMHTLVGGSGGLSGGQRQRVMIARALVGQPRIVVFDEATSALDNSNQATVSENLRTFKSTRIVVAHRLSTIQTADRIYVLDRGRVVQVGTYATLAAEEGLFSSLAKRQLA